jgi:beta-amylase
MQGVMVDVWWGIVERAHPLVYDFVGYRKLFDCVRAAGLDIQAVMSFHSAGSNVGDTCQIDLPPWVLEVGEDNPDIFYTDASGLLSKDCLSTGCLDEPVLLGRSPLQVCHQILSGTVSYSDTIDAELDMVANCAIQTSPRFVQFKRHQGSKAH